MEQWPTYRAGFALHITLNLMGDPARIKRLATAHSHLLSAKSYVSVDLATDFPASPVELRLVQTTLSESILLACMKDLEASGIAEGPRGGFWRDLQRAAEVLDQSVDARSYHAKFLATLAGDKL